MQSSGVPRWYQELSIPQMKHILALKCVLRRDYQEKVTERMQKILKDVGITSTFVKISSKNLKNIQKLSQLDPGRFLCEIYRYITGNYFEDEKYKKFYDCNERLVLSAIALLKLPETINELHRRLPIIKKVEIAPKPLPPSILARKNAVSPYLEPLTVPPDWRSYRVKLEKWRKKCRSIVRPRIILPPAYLLKEDEDIPEIGQHLSELISKHVQPKTHRQKKYYHSAKSSDENDNFQFLISASSNTPSGTSKESIVDDNKECKESNRKLNENYDGDYLSDIVENYEDVEKGENEDEEVYEEYIDNPAVVNSDAPPNYLKKYSPGRENLSLRWQEWFADVDEEYRKLEKIANCMLDDVREVSRNINDADMCGGCCAYGQTQKFLDNRCFNNRCFNKNSYQLVDSVASGNDGVTVPESNSLQENMSFEKIIKTKLISGVTVDENENTHYLNSGVVNHRLPIPKKIKDPAKKNVPPCACHNPLESDNNDDETEDHYVGDGVAEKYRKNQISLCNKCDISENTIFQEFEKACRDRECRQKQTLESTDHKTCTQRFFIDEDKIDKNLKAMHGDKYDRNLMAQNILSEFTMQTSITMIPESSQFDRRQINVNEPHRHWSITQFTPKPKPMGYKPIIKGRDKFSIDKVRKIINEPFSKEVEDLFQTVRELKLNFSKESSDQFVPKNNNQDNIGDNMENVSMLTSLSNGNMKKRKQKIKTQKNTVDQLGTIKSNDGYDENLNKLNVSKDETESMEELKNSKMKFSDSESTKLIDLMKIALKEMADEGYLLAKLPECYNLPQLKIWIMHREGFTLSDKQTRELLEKSEKMWDIIEFGKRKKISMPTLIMRIVKERKSIGYNNFKKFERAIQLEKKLFYSKMRKLRVLKSRELWNQMEFEKFPNLGFKQAFFTYLPSKEADDYLKRPYRYNPDYETN